MFILRKVNRRGCRHRLLSEWTVNSVVFRLHCFPPQAFRIVVITVGSKPINECSIHSMPARLSSF
ncbi:hypothetical protein BRC2024_ULFKEANI_CDS_0064 [Acinetobacter phage vB_AbaM_Konradin-v2]